MKKLTLIPMKNAQTGALEVSRQTVDKNGDELTIFMVQQQKHNVIGGRLRTANRNAIVSVPRALESSLGLTDGCDVNQKFKALGLPEMEIIRTESLEKAWDSQEPKINPSTGDIITDVNGSPIYMQDQAFTVGTREDVLIASAGQAGSSVSASAEVAEEGDHA